MLLDDWLTWESLKAFANSNFFTSLVGAMAGAVGGAYAVQKIADRAKVRDQLLQEIRNCCSAIEFAHSVGNTYLNLKEQHVRRMQERYVMQYTAVHQFREDREAGAIPADMGIDLGAVDMSVMETIHARIPQLETMILEKVSASGRPRPLVLTLGKAADQLNHSINERNQMVMELRDIDEGERNHRLFGLRMGRHVDRRFPDNMFGIFSYTDDCIMFSRMLCEELTSHGRRVRQIYLRRFGGWVQTITAVDFSEPDAKGLFPSRERYRSWDENIQFRVGRTEGRRMGKALYATRRFLRKGVRHASCGMGVREG